MTVTWRDKAEIAVFALMGWYATFGIIGFGINRVADELAKIGKTLKDIHEDMP